MSFPHAFIVVIALLPLVNSTAAPSVLSDNLPLTMPSAGAHQLRVLTPTLLELTLITTKNPDPARAREWNFVAADGKPRLPALKEFTVVTPDKTRAVKAVGFKRRVLYAPLKERDLRIANSLYLELESPLAENQNVEVQNPSRSLWQPPVRFAARTEPQRWNPAIHVNQVGYLPNAPKKAMVGYYLGSLGELDPTKHLNSTERPFKLIDTASGKEVFSGQLKPRPDEGFPDKSYQNVLEADFTAFQTPGEYRLQVEGMGVSFPFLIDDGIAAAFARTYALGLYHQRCGTGNDLPFTRFTHGPCHTAPAEIPSRSSEAVNDVLSKETEDFKDNPRHKAPRMKDVAASLYPFVKRGKVDVSGGHHDAGDYSKYTMNSVAFVHCLVFAADNFPGVAELDNLGLPESGDGKSDILQEAKWESDFIARMQDDDGGFYFLVYPRDRRYENDVTPDKGDPQVVFPKTTAVTAASVAALAQCASSPKFKEQFPDAARLYLEKAKKGWAFLERAIAKHGKDGAYQKITHYGDEFMHDDELAWAACELFLATGEPDYAQKLEAWLQPEDPDNRRWGWWRLHGTFGNPIRSYAFAVKSGRMKHEQLSPSLLQACERELGAAADDQLRRARQSAYGTSFPEETKRTMTAGWYFSGDAAFDLAVGYHLDPPADNDTRPQILEAILSNLNYEAGCNPINVTYITGLGWKRQREIVHQYAQNDERVLPPTGIPLGNLQGGFGWIDPYGNELGNLSFPPDGDADSTYPIYDRWGDSFNLSTEFVVSNQTRALAYLAWLMARTPLKSQPWKSGVAQIKVTPRTGGGPGLTAEVAAPGLDLARSRIVWEARGQEPAIGKTYSFSPAKSGWIEVEVQLPDGRRAFGVTNAAGR